MKPSTRAVARPTRLAFALVPGFLDVSLGVTTAIVQTANALCRATGQPEAFELSLVAPARGTSLSAAGIKVKHQPLDVASDADVLVVPGVFIEDAAAMHAWVTQSSMAPWLAMLGDFFAFSQRQSQARSASWRRCYAAALSQNALYGRVISIKQLGDLLKRLPFAPALPHQGPLAFRVIDSRSLLHSQHPFCLCSL